MMRSGITQVRSPSLANIMYAPHAFSHDWLVNVMMGSSNVHDFHHYHAVALKIQVREEKGRTRKEG